MVGTSAPLTTRPCEAPLPEPLAKLSAVPRCRRWPPPKTGLPQCRWSRRPCRRGCRPGSPHSAPRACPAPMRPAGPQATVRCLRTSRPTPAAPLQPAGAKSWFAWSLEGRSCRCRGKMSFKPEKAVSNGCARFSGKSQAGAAGTASCRGRIRRLYDAQNLPKSLADRPFPAPRAVPKTLTPRRSPPIRPRFPGWTKI